MHFFLLKYTPLKLSPDTRGSLLEKKLSQKNVPYSCQRAICNHCTTYRNLYGTLFQKGSVLLKKLCYKNVLGSQNMYYKYQSWQK